MTKEAQENEPDKPIFYSERQVTPADPRSDAGDVDIVERARRFAIQAEKWEKGGKYRNDVIRFLQFGRYIKEMRQALNLTRKQLAAMAQVEAESVFLLEKGMLTKAELEEVLQKIACSLHTTFIDLRERLSMPFPNDWKGPFI